MPRLFALLLSAAVGVLGAAGVAQAQPSYAVLYSFAAGADGQLPVSALIQATDGNFYGTTALGGGDGCFGLTCGVVFQMTPDGTVTVLHPFTGGPDDGWRPSNALIQATDGKLYGTTAAGGAPGCATNGCGTVFRLTLAP